MITLTEAIERGASKFPGEHVLVDLHFTRTDAPDQRLVLPFNYNPSTYEHTRHSDRMAQEVFACALETAASVGQYSDPDEFVRDLYDRNFEDNMTVHEYREALAEWGRIQERNSELESFIGGGNTSAYDRLLEADEEVRSRYVTLHVRGAS